MHELANLCTPKVLVANFALLSFALLSFAFYPLSSVTYPLSSIFYLLPSVLYLLSCFFGGYFCLENPASFNCGELLILKSCWQVLPSQYFQILNKLTINYKLFHFHQIPNLCSLFCRLFIYMVKLLRYINLMF